MRKKGSKEMMPRIDEVDRNIWSMLDWSDYEMQKILKRYLRIEREEQK